MTAPRPDEITVEIRLDTDTTLTLTGFRWSEEYVRNKATHAAQAIKGDGWQPSSEQVSVTTRYLANPPRASRPRHPGEIPPKSECCGAYMAELGVADGVLYEISVLDHCPRCGLPEQQPSPPKHTPDEMRAIDLTADLWNAFKALPTEHPNEASDVADAIHTIQAILAFRLARRADPRTWPVKVKPQQAGSYNPDKHGAKHRRST